MRIATGRRLASYEVIAPLGHGGMGEVYKARDAKLGREVAVKLLPEAFARDPERLMRFEREARLLASLNHPNIAAIYGLEESEGCPFLVLELVPGETLGERLAGGALPQPEAFLIARQIAEALEAAHENGIIHRDLKPANVKVTPDGKIKVLDFGLAKALLPETSPPDLSRSPTITSEATRDGVVLGTAAYMSPEQARGRPLDKRTDIWSFGCVLFEALTGRKAFEGETVSDTIAAILRSDPDWELLPKSLPTRLRTLLRRCLEKEPNRRLRDIGDARIEMEEETEDLTGSSPLPAVSPVRPPVRFVIGFSPDAPLELEKQPAVALSPLGTHLVYVAGRQGVTHLYLRSLGRLEATPMPGTEGARGPFFSRDGNWVAFFAEGKLKKAAIAGGAPLTICDASDARGGAWGPDDNILFSPTASSGLLRVPAGGGVPSPATMLDFENGERTHRWPQILQRGKLVLFTLGTAGTSSFDDGLIVLQSLSTGERRVLVQGGTGARYLPTGHLVYAREGSLLATPFDPTRPRITGAALPILDGLMTEATGAAHFDFSGVGSLVHVPGKAQKIRRRLLWLDRGGAQEPLSLPPRSYEEPRLSPDASRLALSIGGMTHDVWVYDLSRGTLTRLTFEGENFAPIWTPDGKRITFSSNRDGPSNLFWKASDGSGAEERLLASEYEKVHGSWSADGHVLAFTEYHVRTGADIWLLPIDGDRTPRPLLQTPFNEFAPTFSPDGRWLAYSSDESGRNEVYLMPASGTGGKWQISSDGGAEPVWAKNGKELFYRDGQRMMSVSIAAEPTFAAGAPRLLFEREEAKTLGFWVNRLPDYDVGPGDRFLVIEESEERQAPAHLEVTLEWFTEVSQRVPPGIEFGRQGGPNARLHG